MFDHSAVIPSEGDSKSNEDLLSSGEAARLLGVSTQSVRNFYNVGRLTGRRIEGAHYFKRADVIAFGLTRGKGVIHSK